MNFRFLCAFPLLLMTTVNCETIHFTNSPGHLVHSKNFTTYKLDVPGSNTITIIEANDNDDDEHQPLSNIKQEIDNNNGSHEDQPSESKTSSKKTVFAPTLLDKFLKEYKTKVKSPTISVDSKYHEDSIESQGGVRRDRYRDYERFDEDDYQRPPKIRIPFHEKEGWVSLQAVPWSKSHVAKWRPKGDVKPVETVSGINVYRKPNPFKNEATSSSNWEDSSEQFKMSHYSQNRPMLYDYDERDHFMNSNSNPVTPYMPVPWNTNKPSRWSGGHHNHEIEAAASSSSSSNDRWFDYGHRPDFDDPQRPMDDEIIVSDYNANVVRTPVVRRKQHQYQQQPQQQQQQQQQQYQQQYQQQQQQHNKQPQHSYRSPYSRYPSTYPTNGNGEWVLVSTTKGYHTNRVHRGMNFTESKPSGISFKTHKAIKLTVLPAKLGAGNQTSMTTSHGGLLEVDSSRQPVELSAAAAELNRKKIKSKQKGVVKSTTTKLIKAVPVNSKVNDESAVLAAVGAGMVPATVAMLMPIVLGRKRREIRNLNGVDDST